MFVETENGNSAATIILTGKEILEMAKIKKCLKKILTLARHFYMEQDMVKAEQVIRQKLSSQSIITTGDFSKQIFDR